jgi:hypothetical protein
MANARATSYASRRALVKGVTGDVSTQATGLPHGPACIARNITRQ